MENTTTQLGPESDATPTDAKGLEFEKSMNVRRIEEFLWPPKDELGFHVLTRGVRLAILGVLVYLVVKKKK